MKFALAFGLVVLALLSYFALALFFGVYQRYPLAHLFVAALGVVLMLVQMKQRASWLRAVTTIAAVALFALFTWWSLGYSTYAKQERARGEEAGVNGQARLLVKTSEGEDFDFNAALKKSRPHAVDL